MSKPLSMLMKLKLTHSFISTVLRMLASNYHALPSTLRSRMKMSAFFLGARRIPTTTSASKTLLDDDSEDEDGAATTLVYQLSRASELAVNDDPQGELSYTCSLRPRR